MRSELLQQLDHQNKMKELERKQNEAYMQEWTKNVEGEAKKRKIVEE